MTGDAGIGSRPSSEVFRVRASLTVVSNYLILAFLTVIVPAQFVWGVLHPKAETQVPPFLVGPWVLIMAWNWFVILSRPHLIELSHDNVAFVSVFGRTIVSAVDIVAVRPALWGQGELVVRHVGGRIRLLHDYQRFDDFMRQLTAVNPRVDTTGREWALFP